MLPTLKRTAGFGGLEMLGPIMGSEDFPVFAKSIPSVFFFLGVTPKGQDLATAPANHSPLFFADEGALETGVRAMANLATDYLAGGKVRQ
jgi:amidohydrolase